MTDDQEIERWITLLRNAMARPSDTVVLAVCGEAGDLICMSRVLRGTDLRAIASTLRNLRRDPA